MVFPLLSSSAISSISLSDVQTSKKGQKYCTIEFDGKSSIFQLSKDALLSPFQAGIYQKDSAVETRQNLELHVNDELRGILEEYDEFFERELKIMPKATYHKLVQQENDYPARLRLKVNACGPNACHFWQEDQTPLGDVRTVKTTGAKSFRFFWLGRVP